MQVYRQKYQHQKVLVQLEQMQALLLQYPLRSAHQMEKETLKQLALTQQRYLHHRLLRHLQPQQQV